jgi:phenylacetaldehyde dehydrogenase
VRCGFTFSTRPRALAWVNCYNLTDPASPFGGYKQSGWGREMGRGALELYTETKSVWVNLT